MGSTPQQAFLARNIFQPVNGFRANLPSVPDFQPSFALHDGGKSDNMLKLYEALQGDWLYEEASRNVTFLDNHDVSRSYSVIGEDFARYKMGLAWLLTSRGIPQLYYGTEVLMKNLFNPHRLVRADFPGGFACGSLNYFKSCPSQPGEAFEYVRKLANYRKTHAFLHSGKLMQFIPQEGVYVYFRYASEGTVMVVLNGSKEARTLDGGRFAERTGGFSSGVEITTGAVLPDLKSFTVPAATAWMVELR